MSASLSAERRKARPSLPGAPPKKSKSKKPSKPFVVASGVVSGVRTTAISGGTMFTASADAPLQWKGEWHFNNRVNHKHAFTYRTVGGTDLRAAAESCDLAWETVEPPATPSSEPRRPDSPAHSAASQGLPGVASEPAAAPAPAVGTPVSTPGGGAPAGSTTGSAASVEAPGALDWGVYVPPSRPAVSCPIPSGLVWLGEFFVPSMRSSTAEDTDSISEVFVLWATHELVDEPGVFAVTGHGVNEIGRFGFTGWVEPDGRSLAVRKVYIPRKRPKRRRSPASATPGERRVSNRKRIISRRLSMDDSDEESVATTASSKRGRTRAARRAAAGAGAGAGASRPGKSAEALASKSNARSRAIKRRSPSVDSSATGGTAVSTASGARLARPKPSPAKRARGAAWTPKLVVGSQCHYEGDLLRQEPSGHGTCVYRSGLMYEGGWHQGREHGWGVLSDAHDATLYEGEFADGKLSGVGVYYFPNGDIYEGEWRDSAFHGVGKFTRAGGDGSFEGDWRDGRRHGRGVLTAGAAFMYSGEWAHDAAHGKGTLTTASGLSYSGHWAEGLFDGRGDCQYPDGSSYQGTFKAGLRDGRGTLTFPNGAVYNGRFREDRLEGSGTLSVSRPVPAEDGSDTVLVPVSLQADMKLVHLRAGFTSKGL